MSYCFYCGDHYHKSDSLAANTPELHAETYCSRICYDKDTEQMERDIKLAQELDKTVGPEASTIPIIEEVKAGGFILKVRKP